VEPNGTPARPSADVEPIPVGEDADPAGPAVVLVAMPAQVPEAVPMVPPPSKRLIEPGVAGVGVPVLVLDKFPAGELTPPQVAMLPLPAGPTGDIPEVVGLTPTDPSSVLPRGIPVRGTAGAGPMPSGEVMPSGDGPLPPTWADAKPQPNNVATSAAINKRVIMAFSLFRISPTPSRARRTANQ